jgi:hypothetical protein
MRNGFRLPSPALILAVIALVAATTGASYAAVKIGKGTVTTKSLKNKSVTKKKLAPAVRGQAVAWAEVAANGSLTASRGIVSANLTSSANGFYCFDNLPAHGAEAVTPGWTGDEFGSFAIASISKPASTDIGCAAGTELAVVTQFFNIATDAAPYSPRAFTIVLHK